MGCVGQVNDLHLMQHPLFHQQRQYLQQPLQHHLLGGGGPCLAAHLRIQQRQPLDLDVLAPLGGADGVHDVPLVAQQVHRAVLLDGHRVPALRHLHHQLVGQHPPELHRLHIGELLADAGRCVVLVQQEQVVPRLYLRRRHDLLLGVAAVAVDLDILDLEKHGQCEADGAADQHKGQQLIEEGKASPPPFAIVPSASCHDLKLLTCRLPGYGRPTAPDRR